MCSVYDYHCLEFCPDHGAVDVNVNVNKTGASYLGKEVQVRIQLDEGHISGQLIAFCAEK